MVSLHLIKPDTIKRLPTISLEMVINIFIENEMILINCLNESTQIPNN